MQVANTAPSRQPIRYYGSGWKRAEWIISHMPEHANYLEPCFGGGSVLLKKPAVLLETVNDIDGRVVNFFRVVRERVDELLHLINLSPWAEAEMATCAQVSPDSLEDARRFFMLCWFNIHGGPIATSFRYQKSVVSRYGNPANDAVDRTDLLDTARRLKNVQILSRDAIELLRKYHRSEDCLIYFDPPYLQETRKRSKGYRHEVTPAWHRLAAYWLRQHKGYALVSGYRSRLYERLYEAYGWQRVERTQRTNGNSLATECLWISPRTQAALQRDRMPLFAQEPA